MSYYFNKTFVHIADTTHIMMTLILSTSGAPSPLVIKPDPALLTPPTRNPPIVIEPDPSLLTPPAVGGALELEYLASPDPTPAPPSNSPATPMPQPPVPQRVKLETGKPPRRRCVKQCFVVIIIYIVFILLFMMYLTSKKMSYLLLCSLVWRRRVQVQEEYAACLQGNKFFFLNKFFILK